MGTSERKEREKEAMRRRIMDMAMKLFLSDGYENVSMRRIAEQIEYSPATIYLYFRDKDEVFYALHKEGFRQLYERQQRVQDVENPVERLMAHGRAYVSFALENQRLYDLMFIMRGPVKVMDRKDDWETAGDSYNLLRQNVTQCFEAGYFSRNDPEVVAFSMWSMVHGISSLVIRGRTQMMPDEVVQSLVEGAMEFLGSVLKSQALPDSSKSSNSA